MDEWVKVRLLVNCRFGLIGDVVEMPRVTAMRYIRDGRAEAIADA